MLMKIRYTPFEDSRLLTAPNADLYFYLDALKRMSETKKIGTQFTDLVNIVKTKISTVAIIFFLLYFGLHSCGEAQTEQPVSLTEQIGDTIDSAERESYGLFPDIKDFVSARFIRVDDDSYILELVRKNRNGNYFKRISISPEAYDQTRLHCELMEKYREIQNRGEDCFDEICRQYQVALKYAAMARYDVGGQLADDLIKENPASGIDEDIRKDCDAISSLSRARRALFMPGSIYGKGGRTDVLIFAGYYGIWVGLALPLALDAKESESFALGLLGGPTASLLLAHGLTKNANISRGRASMISLGGHLGTWQGIGWSSAKEGEKGTEPFAWGLAGGLAGITMASLLTHDVYITEGHGALASAALPWGTWFGLVLGSIGDINDEALLRTVLVGGDVMVLGAIIGAKDVEMSRSRVRLINLSGVLGAVAGFGLVLLSEADDASSVFGITGATSAAGLIIGYNITKNHDSRRIVASAGRNRALPTISPMLAAQSGWPNHGKPAPLFGFKINF
jgi:hypothetical protein